VTACQHTAATQTPSVAAAAAAAAAHQPQSSSHFDVDRGDSQAPTTNGHGFFSDFDASRDQSCWMRPLNVAGY